MTKKELRLYIDERNCSRNYFCEKTSKADGSKPSDDRGEFEFDWARRKTKISEKTFSLAAETLSIVWTSPRFEFPVLKN